MSSWFRSLVLLVVVGLIAVGERASSSYAAQSQVLSDATVAQAAYFKFDYPPYPETFVFELTDPDKIQMARQMLAGESPDRHVMGTIVKQAAAYNQPWSFYLAPETITFFEFAIEACDAPIRYVEDHLDEACGAFLPGCQWCPWASRLLAEVDPEPSPPPPTHTRYLPLVRKAD